MPSCIGSLSLSSTLWTCTKTSWLATSSPSRFFRLMMSTSMLRSYLLRLRIRGQRSMRLILWGCRWRACERSCQMWCRCLQPPRSTPERRQSQTLWLWLVHACEPTGPTYPCGDLHGQAGGQWGCTSILAQGAPQVQKPWWLCDGSRVWLCSILTRRLQAGEVLGRWPFSRSQAQTDLCLHAYNALCVKRLGRRFKKINLSAAEQVFSWFRNYARPLNESRPLRHALKVLFFVKEHNKAIQQKRATYLNKHQAPGKKASKKYACTMKIVKKPAMKMSKVMKAMKK